MFPQVERNDVIGNHYALSVEGYLTATGFRVRYWDSDHVTGPRIRLLVVAGRLLAESERPLNGTSEAIRDQHSRAIRGQRHPLVHFTPRQEQILALAAAGHLDKEIAIALEIALPTVRTHLERLYREYGLHNRTEAVTVWLSMSNKST